MTGGLGFKMSSLNSSNLINSSSTSDAETRTTLCPNSSAINIAVSASIG